MKSEYYITPIATDQRLTRLLDGFGQRLSSGIWHCFFTDEQLSRIRTWYGERIQIERAELLQMSVDQLASTPAGDD